jgi:hypothetical protein
LSPNEIVDVTVVFDVYTMGQWVWFAKIVATHMTLALMSPTSGLVCPIRPEPLDIDWVIEEEGQTYTQNLYDVL